MLAIAKNLARGLCAFTLLIGASIGCWPASADVLDIIYNAEEEPSEKVLISQVLQSQLGAKGITVRLEPLPSAVYNDRISRGEYEAALTLWYLDYNHPEGYLTDFQSGASYRLSRYENAKFDALYLKGLHAKDRDVMWSSFRSAAAMIDNDRPWVPLFSDADLFLIRSGAEGFKANSFQYYDYRDVNLKNIRAATEIEVQTFDPALTYDLASKHIVTQSYEGLIALNERNEIVPALATDWTVSDDGLTIRFRLRPGVSFHPSAYASNQQTLTADDVKASFERTVRANSPYSYIFDNVAGVAEFKNRNADHISGFVAVNPLTFEMRMQKPMPVMLQWLLVPAAYVMPKNTPVDYDFRRGSVGTGPFVLKNWDGAEARFIAHDSYWGTRGDQRQPLAKTLSIRIIKEAAVQYAAARQGHLDIVNVPIALLDGVSDATGKVTDDLKDFSLREVDLSNLKMIAFNMKQSPWGSDRNMRELVSTAINRDLIVKHIFRGHARPALSVVPNGMFPPLAAPHSND